jgi:hypothetical protein
MKTSLPRMDADSHGSGQGVAVCRCSEEIDEEFRWMS